MTSQLFRTRPQYKERFILKFGEIKVFGNESKKIENTRVNNRLDSEITCCDLYRNICLPVTYKESIR
jgi:hypothetical protein